MANDFDCIRNRDMDGPRQLLSRRRMVALLAPVVLLLAQAAWAQDPVSADLIVSEGDALTSGAVATLYNPAINGNGKVAAIGLSSQPGKFLFREGVGFEDVSSYGIDSITSIQIGYDDNETIAWLPLVLAQNQWYRNTTEILNTNQDIPGTGFETNDIRRPTLTPDGQAFVWATSAIGTYILRAAALTPEVYLGENDVTSHGTLADIRPVFDVSASGGNVILIMTVDEAPGRRVVFGATQVVAVGDAVDSSTWADFDNVAVIDTGESLVAGPDAGGIEHLAYASGSTVVSVLDEGDTVDGIVLADGPGPIGLNEAGEAAFIWPDGDTTNHLFAACDPAAGLSTNGMRVLSEGDEIDLNQDQVPDATITSFDFGNGSQLAFDDAGRVALKVTLDGSQDAVIRVNTLCQAGNIIVRKTTVPEQTGPEDPQSFAFSSCLGDPLVLFHGEQQLLLHVDTGTCAISESAVAGWDLTGLNCDDDNSTEDLETRTATVSLQPGETVTCTFTNMQRGTIVVEKQTTPDASEQTFEFSGDASGTLGDGQQITVADLQPGAYTSTELPTEGWALQAIDCDDGNSSGDVETGLATFNLDAGETVTCVFFNILEILLPLFEDGFESD